MSMTQAVFNPASNDLELVKLAREIAMDIQPIETILKHYAISDEQWSKLQRSTRFISLLSSEVESWQTALNTHERVKLKSAAMLEEWLPELYRRMHNNDEAMPAVVEAGKMLSKLAGLGGEKDIGAGIGERFVINISMGPKVEPVTFAKDVTPQVTIDHEGH
jgi:hypothetical protein